ncbi:hypothetical protein GLAREA_02344 [Glarea lozoyensis ATCC 20868]|uniref:Uncharacterized protein n=2 Tax=Glarea lozoyensis TaxID=101852 RepID=S3D2Z9_GLAL2|nr:uncharacterized protein GLAREA_02344 [Glarea lozoyensis ATCC 20868]EHL01051.1 hypothetical protein M7I_3013 [Glarea lozoyensis 74030]EPE26431.1 hypothetical protein GLAREA_02344 [Glarea lozoyensis ATCC 20868]
MSPLLHLLLVLLLLPHLTLADCGPDYCGFKIGGRCYCLGDPESCAYYCRLDYGDIVVFILMAIGLMSLIRIVMSIWWATVGGLWWIVCAFFWVVFGGGNKKRDA